MGRALDTATARPRTAPAAPLAGLVAGPLAGPLAGTVAAALALMAPTLLLTAVDTPTTVSLAVVTLVLAALVRLGHHGVVLASRTVPPRIPTRGEMSPVLTGRITDPVHHPLRPRAPGPA